MSLWLALALAIIIGGGFAILRRLRLLHIAITFWVTFTASIAVIAASGHDMTANWHLGPVSDWYFWRVLAFSPEILVFLFFMITDPKTIPARQSRAPGLRGLDRPAGGAVARPADDRVRLQGGGPRLAGDRLRGAAAAGAARRRRPQAGLGRPIRRARGESRSRCGGARRRRRLRRPAGRRREPGPLERRGDGAPRAASSELVAVTVQPAAGIAPIDERTARQIARDLVADLENESRRYGPRPHARDGGRGRRPPGGAVAADRGDGRRGRSSLTTRSSASVSTSSAATARLRRRSWRVAGR